MFRTLKTYLYCAHWLSLDVVAGAVLSSWAVWRLPNGKGQANPWALVLLGVAVWAVYIADRLFDLRKNPHLRTPRHDFHRLHYGLLRWIVVGLGTVGLLGAAMLHRSVLGLGLALGLACVLYLFLIVRLPAAHWAQSSKEYFVALAYAVGVWGPALVSQPDTGAFAWVLAGVHAVVVFQSLLLYSWIEAFEADEAHSLAAYWGEEATHRALQYLTVGLVAALIGLLPFAQHIYQLRFVFISMLMVLAQHLFIVCRPQVQLRERYRWLGELVFWLPGLL